MFCFCAEFILSSANAFNLVQSKVLLFGTQLPFNPFQNKAWFLHVSSTSVLKTLWEKEQEGHDSPVSLHWLILGYLLKTSEPGEGLKLVAMSSNKKILKYFTK